MVQSDVSFNVSELGKGKMNGYISSIVVSMLLFFAIYFYGYGVAMSVASEKTSRVMIDYWRGCMKSGYFNRNLREIFLPL